MVGGAVVGGVVVGGAVVGGTDQPGGDAAAQWPLRPRGQRHLHSPL